MLFKALTVKQGLYEVYSITPGDVRTAETERRTGGVFRLWQLRQLRRLALVANLL